jgi:TnpA family transposase
MPQNKWDGIRGEFFAKNKLPPSGESAKNYLTDRLNKAYDQYFLAEKNNPYAKVVDGKWVLSTDHADKLSSTEEQELIKLKKWIATHMRTIKLPDLLVEVDNDLHFSQAFIAPSRQGSRFIEDICEVIITIMAHGCNIGTYSMSQLVENISYDKIKKITDWQLTDESLRLALSWIVNAISKLDVTKSWGEGKTSSSDAHLVPFSSKILQQGYSPPFGDFAMEFYTFVSDNYAPYYGKPIEFSDGESPHVLDGILYNESDLEIEEHYTDTKAAGVMTFTAFAFLGVKYDPRIRGVQNHLIYKIDKNKDYKSLKPLLEHQYNVINIEEIVRHWDRMAHFYASMSHGHMTASISLKRLSLLNSKNEFYNTNLQLGRILKTENTLQSMIDEKKRRKRHRGLLKGEEMHQLARDVSYGNGGKISARDLIGQRNSCNCLTLIMACIVYWQAKAINHLITTQDIESAGLNLSMLQHISPIGWKNIILYGEYIINKDLIKR